MTDFKQLEAQQLDLNREIVAAINVELQRLGCSDISVQISSNRRLGYLAFDCDTRDPAEQVDDILIDPIESLRILVKESPAPYRAEYGG